MSGEVVYSDVKFATKGKKDKEARSSQEEDVTYSQVKKSTAQRSLKAAAEARSSQEEDVTYSQVKKSTAQRSPKAAEAGKRQEDEITYSEIQIGSKTQSAPEQRSKCTKRVVLLVGTAVFVLAVIAIIIIIIIIIVSITPCTNIMVQCDWDWELNGDKCYYFSPNATKLSWTNSRQWCQQHIGNLVKIESEEEQKFLFNKLRGLMTEPDDKFWIGLTDSETEGVWKWTDGSHLNTSSAFWFYNTDNNIKEPDNWTREDPEGEDCVRMGERAEGFALKCWFDHSCIKKNRFICEKQASNCK